MLNKTSLRLIITTYFYALSFCAHAITFDLTTLIPKKLPGDLTLVELVRKGCQDCSPWREVSYMPSVDAYEQQTLKVSVVDGYKAMYVYPESMYFANVKVERADPEEYLKSKQNVITAMRKTTEYGQYHINDYLEEHPDKKQLVKATMLPNVDYLTFHCDQYEGYEYCESMTNDLKLSRGTVAQIAIFVPQYEVIVVAYLLNQKVTHFDGIAEFATLKDQFVRSYIDFLIKRDE